MLDAKILSTNNLEKINLVREIVKTNSKPLTEFDDELFISLIDNVRIASTASFKFVLNNGVAVLLMEQNITMEGSLKVVNTNKEKRFCFSFITIKIIHDITDSSTPHEPFME